jgi:kynurenine formamidase
MPRLIDCSIAIENDIHSDRPLALIAKEFAETRDASIIWEGHFTGIERGYCHSEKLTNLDRLPSHEFAFFCFPVKIKETSAGWVRAVPQIGD